MNKAIIPMKEYEELKRIRKEYNNLRMLQLKEKSLLELEQELLVNLEYSFGYKLCYGEPYQKHIFYTKEDMQSQIDFYIDEEVGKRYNRLKNRTWLGKFLN